MIPVPYSVLPINKKLLDGIFCVLKQSIASGVAQSEVVNCDEVRCSDDKHEVRREVLQDVVD